MKNYDYHCKNGGRDTSRPYPYTANYVPTMNYEL